MSNLWTYKNKRRNHQFQLAVLAEGADLLFKVSTVFTVLGCCYISFFIYLHHGYFKGPTSDMRQIEWLPKALVCERTLSQLCFDKAPSIDVCGAVAHKLRFNWCLSLTIHFLSYHPVFQHPYFSFLLSFCRFFVFFFFFFISVRCVLAHPSWLILQEI